MHNTALAFRKIYYSLAQLEGIPCTLEVMTHIKMEEIPFLRQGSKYSVNICLCVSSGNTQLEKSKLKNVSKIWQPKIFSSKSD